VESLLEFTLDINTEFRECTPKHFEQVAHAIWRLQSDIVAEQTVESLRGQAGIYIEARFQATREDHQEDDGLSQVPELNRVWRDGEPADTTLPRWARSSAEGNKLFDADAINSDSYLGKIRCEFGDSDLYVAGKIEMYLIVDFLITQTANGPRIAGISIY
jgi:hypothetical protein